MSKKASGIVVALFALGAVLLAGCDGPTSTAADQAKKSADLRKVAEQSPNADKVE
jgi:hypothetical protein